MLVVDGVAVFASIDESSGGVLFPVCIHTHTYILSLPLEYPSNSFHPTSPSPVPPLTNPPRAPPQTLKPSPAYAKPPFTSSHLPTQPPHLNLAPAEPPVQPSQITPSPPTNVPRSALAHPQITPKIALIGKQSALISPLPPTLHACITRLRAATRLRIMIG